MSPVKPSRKKAAKTAAKPVRVRGATAGKAASRERGRTTASKTRKTHTKAKSEATTAVKTKTTKKRAARKATLKIPAILLEGDTTSAPPVSGPGQRYVLAPTPPPEHLEPTEEPGELPEAYGTKRLFLTARDPQWVYAHWDLTREQQKRYNALSADGHLILRVYIDTTAGELATQAHVHPDSRHWFVHVGRGGTKYVAELGYHQRKGKWVTIAVSGMATTPVEAASADTSARFATIPVDVPFERLLGLVKTLAAENVPLVQAIEQFRAAGHPALPSPVVFAAKEWTPEQERALAEVVSMDQVRRVWIGSLEITELVRGQLAKEFASQAAAQITSPVGGWGSISSPFGGEQRPKGFWFSVNAELIVYGATEPDAKVTIGGRRIKLRPDGTFSYRFALPDGKYELPAVATSADGEDVRAANLHFARATQYRGKVGAHPQDPALKSPRPEHT
jgi:hypothetical protein